ncbi:MAG: response regulator, partial [Bacteroidota bacterium]
GEQIGYLYLQLSSEEVQARVRESRTAMVWLSLVLLLCCGGMALWMSTVITRPLREITETATRIAGGDLSLRASARANDEVGVLAQTFNRMATQLDEAYPDLARQQEAVETEMSIRERYGRDLLEAKKRVKQATNARSEFLSSMGHEIRTPLNNVIGMTRILRDTDLDEEQGDLAQLIQNSGEVLLALINDILDLAQIEAGNLKLEATPFDVHASLENALSLMAVPASEQGLDLACLIEQDVPVHLVGDADRFRQVILNLLSNAIKFTARGEVVVTASMAPPAADGTPMMHVSVRDTGVGIPRDQQDRLFESFTSVGADATRRLTGTRLGLAICQQITEAMGGHIWVESVEGIGSTFHIVIPAPQPEGQERPTPPEALMGRRLLVVEPSASQRRVLRHYAEQWRMAWVAVSSGAEALEHLARDTAFDMVVLDYHAGRAGGPAVLQRMVDQHPTLPLVLLTAPGHTATPPAATQALLLEKPIRWRPLQAALLEAAKHSTRDSLPGPDPASATEDAERHPIPQEAPVPSSLRILLADDSPINQRVGTLMLQRLGYAADVASDGLQVLEAMQHTTYDVVLMDLRMPNLGGLEAARRIQEEWPASDRPLIVAMTADVTDEHKNACREAGMVAHVAKPIDEDVLRQTLEKVQAIRHRQQSDPDGLPEQAPAEEPVSSDPLLNEDDLEALPVALDLTYIRRTLGAEDPEMVESLLQGYLDEGQHLVESMHEALAEEDYETLERVAHTLKSSSRLWGLVVCARRCAELEASCEKGHLDRLPEQVARAAEAFAEAAAVVKASTLVKGV